MNPFHRPREDAGSIEPLVDGHGRTIGDLRVSVTDLCNLRCQYCMPPEGVDWLDHDEILSFEEITRLVDVFASLGVHSVRMTGGEPLVRRDFPSLAAMIGRVAGVKDLSITTNGFYLERDAEALVEAGIHRFNVSLDALDRERFAKITRRDVYDRVIAGLRALEGVEGVTSIKINAVAMRDFTEQDAVGFAELARTRPYQVRFIEYMPIGGGEWRAEDLLSGDELRAMIDEVYPLMPSVREEHATATVYKFVDGMGEIGFINPVSHPFCADCDRVRLTADGKLRTCLFSLYETDLRGPMRDGATDDDLRKTIREAVWRKELKHAIGDEGFRKPARNMSSIGG